MLRPTVNKVVPRNEYTLELTFDNGEVKTFDVAPYIKGEWYSELKDPAYFRKVFPNGYTVEWENGQDLCPDELYIIAKLFCLTSDGAVRGYLFVRQLCTICF